MHFLVSFLSIFPLFWWIWFQFSSMINISNAIGLKSFYCTNANLRFLALIAIRVIGSSVLTVFDWWKFPSSGFKSSPCLRLPVAEGEVGEEEPITIHQWFKNERNPYQKRPWSYNRFSRTCRQSSCLHQPFSYTHHRTLIRFFLSISSYVISKVLCIAYARSINLGRKDNIDLNKIVPSDRNAKHMVVHYFKLIVCWKDCIKVCLAKLW